MLSKLKAEFVATFARQTGAFVIAEGIEDAETLQFLRSIETLGIPGSDVASVPQPDQPHVLGTSR